MCNSALFPKLCLESQLLKNPQSRLLFRIRLVMGHHSALSVPSVALGWSFSRTGSLAWGRLLWNVKISSVYLELVGLGLHSRTKNRPPEFPFSTTPQQSLLNGPCSVLKQCYCLIIVPISGNRPGPKQIVFRVNVWTGIPNTAAVQCTDHLFSKRRVGMWQTRGLKIAPVSPLSWSEMSRYTSCVFGLLE